MHTTTISNTCKKIMGLLLLFSAPVCFAASADEEISLALQQAVQKQTPTNQTLSANDILNEHKNRLVWVTLSSNLPDRYWVVTCSALLTGKNTLVLDNPGTELLATAFTESAPVSILVDMSPLGAFNQGAYQGKGFFYYGKAYPGNFKVLKNGYAVYQVPVKEPQAVNALQNLQPITLEPEELSALFHHMPVPTSQVFSPREENPIKYNSAQTAPYKTFLKQLEQDITNYLTHFHVQAEVRDCIEFLDQPFPAKGFITAPNGTVILADNGVTPEGSAFWYIEDIKRSGNKEEQVCLYITMPGLGEYENGHSFFSVQPPLPAKDFQLTGVKAFRFIMRLPAQKPVAQKLNSPQVKKLFSQHVITDLWLQNYPPRIQRALDLMP